MFTYLLLVICLFTCNWSYVYGHMFIYF